MIFLSQETSVFRFRFQNTSGTNTFFLAVVCTALVVFVLFRQVLVSTLISMMHFVCLVVYIVCVNLYSQVVIVNCDQPRLIVHIFFSTPCNLLSKIQCPMLRLTCHLIWYNIAKTFIPFEIEGLSFGFIVRVIWSAIYSLGILLFLVAIATCIRYLCSGYMKVWFSAGWSFYTSLSFVVRGR